MMMTPDDARDPYQTEEARAGEERLKEAEARLDRSSATFARLTARIERLRRKEQS